MRTAAERPPIVALVGPTGAGKTKLALALGGLRPGGREVEIVSCDSQAVYRGLEIGTAKPLPEERAALPHHLLDVVEPGGDFSAARFAVLADDAIDGIAARGRLPLVVGGTGLYLRALVDGIFAGPSRDDEVRGALEARIAEVGPEALHRELAQVDPAAAARISPRDPVRIVRALEVFTLTGRPITALHEEERGRPKRYRALVLGVTPPRDELYRRVDARARAMFEGGLVPEAAALAREPATADRLARTMGYREALEVDAGAIGLEEAIARTAQEQRRYAKRQLTWFRALEAVEWLPWPPEPAEAAARITRFLTASSAAR